jgi:DNA-binding MarR family transcriptional regulator
MSLATPELGRETALESDTVRREPDLDEAYPRLLYRLLKLSNLIGRPFFTHFADRHDLALNDVRVLMSLAHVGQGASHELCDATGMHPMNVSRSVARLKRQGRITDRADPGNRRRKLLTPTDEGWALYHMLAPHVKVLSEFVFASLSEREVEFLSSLIAVLSDRLESVDLNSPQLIDTEALKRAAADEAVQTPPPVLKSRRRRAAASN